MKIENVTEFMSSHARSLAGSHPVVTFGLLAVGIATVGKGIMGVLAPKTSTAQPPTTTLKPGA